ncbi:MAG: FecR domain-containing protein [Bacteroidetes bacterium]|nr:FecR domain-containing protein [Bacteroidota bacterium]
MLTTQQLEDLLAKPSLSEEEAQLLLDYLEEGNAGQLVGILRERFAGALNGGVRVDEARREELLARVKERVGLPRPKVRRIFEWRWAAAAAVIVLASGVYFYNQRRMPTKPIAAVPAIHPGGNHATLSTGQGRVIVLDSSKGQLLAQGGLKVTNGDGRLDYEGAAGSVEYHTLTTPRGGQYHLVLPDGTQVWLNAASSIRYPTAFEGKERRVSITGEAYFEVTKDKSKPFHVNLPDRSEVEVLGTHFNIESYDDEPSVQTTLLEGSVGVNSGGQRLVIAPGEQAVEKTGRLEVKKDADLEVVMAWKNGIFLFNRTELREAMRQISRWYDVDVIYEKKMPSNIRFWGEIKRDLNVSEVLSMFEKMGVRFKIEGKKIIVL